MSPKLDVGHARAAEPGCFREKGAGGRGALPAPQPRRAPGLRGRFLPLYSIQWAPCSIPPFGARFTGDSCHQGRGGAEILHHPPPPSPGIKGAVPRFSLAPVAKWVCSPGMPARLDFYFFQKYLTTTKYWAIT